MPFPLRPRKRHISYQFLQNTSAGISYVKWYGSVWKGRAVDLNSAYPNQGSSTSLDSLTGTFGDDSNTLKLGNTTNANLKTEDSLRGEAYRTLVGSTKTTANLKPDDSIFDGHKDFPENQDKYMQDLGDCSMTRTMTNKDTVNHIPDYRECTRTTSVSGTFTLYHPYVAGMLSHYSGAANIGSCGTNCIELWLGTVGDNYWDGNCKIFEQAMAVTVYNPQAVTSAVIVRQNGMTICKFTSAEQTELALYGVGHTVLVRSPKQLESVNLAPVGISQLM